jgi:TonB family protein
MSMSIRTSGRSTSNLRRVPRCPLSVPVRVTMRNASGVQGIPGRSLDLGEGGIAAILAGAVNPGDSVAVEFLLPDMGLGLQAKAVVRHHADLRCGLEFFGLSLEQQAMIRRWTRRMLEKPTSATSVVPHNVPPVEIDPEPAVRFQVPVPQPEVHKSGHHGKFWGRLVAVFAVAATAGALVAWRSWHMEWVELQRQADAVTATSAQRLKLPPGAIDPLTVHKVDAVLPAGETNKNGIALVHIVVAADGTVIDARSENGTEVFNRAAVDAVKDWRFQPYRVDGAPVEIETTVAVEFH